MTSPCSWIIINRGTSVVTYHYEKNTTEERRCVIEKREKTSEKQTSPDRAAVAYRMTSRTSGTTGKTPSDSFIIGNHF